MYDDLKKKVYLANIELVKSGLVVLTWGNASCIDRNKGLIGIKPSGVKYDKMQLSDIVITDLEGNIVEGDCKPSSDLSTHTYLYKSWTHVGGIVHTHSTYATVFSQIQKSIHCFGTTHADHFYGSIPITRNLTSAEIQDNYERNTGKIIIECFRLLKLNPKFIPAILVSNHAPFIWGDSLKSAVENAIALEEIAKMALESLHIKPNITSIPKYVSNKHFSRKNGDKAYYGQKKYK
jgi:L-ribulose-5-phosphate 4-epimerase